MIRAFLRRALSLRALLASAVLCSALALAGCYGEDGYQLPTRAMKELSPEMLSLLEQRKMPKESPILIRIFKEESELEVWKQDTSSHYELLKVYPICRWSGDLGPKVREGDRQAPEGFYAITPGLMNPNSNYYLAINIGFPNSYDRANGHTGAFLMIHGDCSSRGCYAMTDEQIGEIYSLAREAFLGGQKSFQIQAYPFRMTPANLARHRNNPNFAFWKMLKEGNDHFLVSHQEPKVDVCERHYVFDAAPPANSTRPLAFTPAGPCPRFQVDPEIAGPAFELERSDEYKFAQLVNSNMPTAPLTTGTDGGMNRIFAAKLDTPTYTYDENGHVHVPPLQPGRLPPAISPPRGSESDTTAAIAAPPGSGNVVSSFLGGMFTSRTASADASSQPQSHSFFGGLFSTAEAPAAPATAEQTAPPPKTRPSPHSRPTAIAGLRPKLKTEPQSKTAPQEAEARPTVTPRQQQQAEALPPASGTGLSGAQPAVPAGTFSSRWGGIQ